MRKLVLLLTMSFVLFISCSEEDPYAEENRAAQAAGALYTKEYFDEVLLYGECCPGPDDAFCYDCGRDK